MMSEEDEDWDDVFEPSETAAAPGAAAAKQRTFTDMMAAEDDETGPVLTTSFDQMVAQMCSMAQGPRMREAAKVA